MRVDIEISAVSADWPIPLSELQAFANRVLMCAANELPQQLPADCEVSVVLADDATVGALNHQYRGLDRPTNVLSFPLCDGLPCRTGAPAGPPLLLGDIILADGVVQREAKAAGLMLQDHLAHLLVHGFLHLLGYDHVEELEAEKMEALETAILATMQIADPYALRRTEAGFDPQESPIQ